MSDLLIPPEAENIVAINADAEKELEIRRKIRAGKLKCPGQHKSVVVDSEKRLLECKHCGCVIDPFDYIEEWAVEGERRMTGLKGIQTKTRIAHAEYADLTRKINNLRQRLKRAGEPQPIEERREYDAQKWNADYPLSRSPIIVPHKS